MLALTEIENWHNSCLFILRRISLEDLVYELFVCRIELERYIGIIIGCVSVLMVVSMSSRWL